MQKAQSRLSLNKHFAALGAAAAAITGVGVVQQADAAIVYSGPVNYNIPPTFDGLYLNMTTNTTGATGAATPGWDLDVWVTGAGTGTAAWRLFASSNGASADGGVMTTTTNGTTPVVLNNGDPIGPAQLYSTSAGVVPPSGTNMYGIRLFNEATNSIHYGWFRTTLQNPASQSGLLVEFAWEDQADTAIAAGATGGAVPEPASLGLLALGAVGLLRRRSA